MGLPIKKGSTKGFTLIELIIVIAIIGLLATLGIGGYQNVQVNSRNTKRKADLREMKKALTAYYADNNAYPSTGGSWWGTCSSYGSKGDTGSGGYIPNLAPAYIDKLPRDPREGIPNTSNNTGCTAANTCYLYRSNTTDYKILAHCTPEGTLSSTDPFDDPRGRDHSWAVWSSPVSDGW